MKKKPLIVISALIFTLAILALGYVSFGLLTTVIFTSGFIIGGTDIIETLYRRLSLTVFW